MQVRWQNKNGVWTYGRVEVTHRKHYAVRPISHTWAVYQTPLQLVKQSQVEIVSAS